MNLKKPCKVVFVDHKKVIDFDDINFRSTSDPVKNFQHFIYKLYLKTTLLNERIFFFNSKIHVFISGMIYSTMFGGGSSSYATKKEESAYFRNFQFSSFVDSKLPAGSG